VGALAIAQRGLVDDDQLALLAEVFPSLDRGPLGTSHRADPDERHLVLRALHRLLELLAAERPLLLALDDLQWADPASIDLVCHLLHRGLSGRALVLLALRPGQSEPRLNVVVGDTERHGQAMRFELGPLSIAEAKQLLGDEIAPALAESLYAESGGNPFYLEQLAATRRGLETAPQEQSASGLSWMPRRVSASIRSELNDLSPSARALLQGAAVAGDPFEPELAAETAGLAEHDAIGVLDELLQHDLIRVTDSPRRFCFRHPIVRLAVYEAAGTGWRLQAHRLAAAFLETRGAPPAARAHHIERSARVGDAQSAAILAQAGQELMYLSPATAAHWFEIGLNLTPLREESLKLRLWLMAQHAIGLMLAGEIEAGRDEARRFLALAPVGGLRQVITVACVTFDIFLGHNADARRLLLDELAKLPDQLDPQAAELKYHLATTYFYDGDWMGLRSRSSEALAADCQGMARVGSLACLALADFSLARSDHAQRRVHEAAQVFDGLADEKVVADRGAAIHLAMAEIYAERLADADRHCERLIVVSRANGQRLITVGLLAVQAFALAMMGRVHELTVVAEAATEAALLSIGDLLLPVTMGARAFASVLAGDLQSALYFAEHSASAALGTSSPVSSSVRLMLAIALLEMGEPRRCREQLTGPKGEPRLPPASFEAYAYGLLVEAEIALGDLTRAEELSRRSVDSSERFKTNLSIALAQRAVALVALERGEAQAAVTAALDSYQAAERAGAQVEAARSQTLAGRALAANGDRTTAIATLQAAHATLLTCGALHYSDQAARELRKLGRVVPRSSGRQRDQQSTLGLTQREHEVMEQVAAGKTNREIAEGLFLSPRTVDRHLARIFAKLNVHSRAAATGAFTRATNHTRPTPRRPSAQFGRGLPQ
jgi:DNA-binding NarL/FixJ family response regulator